MYRACHITIRCSERRSHSMGITPIRPFKVARDGDRHAAHRDIGIGTLSVKVTTADSNGAFLVAEIAHHAKGGPPRHLHHDQDEWFHVVEENTSSRSAMSGTCWGPVTRRSDRAAYPTAGST